MTTLLPHVSTKIPTEPSQYPVSGCGLGLRRSLIADLSAHQPHEISFLELAPENWIHIGGALGKKLNYFSERYPIVCHGLSLSLGGPNPLDLSFLSEIKTFLNKHQVCCYSEHLSYCSDSGHLYDLMPIPFTQEAVTYVADRIKRVQDILERKIAIENVSAYVAPGKEMEETAFINAILSEANCQLLLDVNNVYVNSVNFDFDPVKYLQTLPTERIAYCHIAGHRKESDDCIVDTHGADVIDPVWDLLDHTYRMFGVIPTLLERDFEFPPFSKLLEELRHIQQYQERYRQQTSQANANASANAQA